MCELKRLTLAGSDSDYSREEHESNSNERGFAGNPLHRPVNGPLSQWNPGMVKSVILYGFRFHSGIGQ